MLSLRPEYQPLMLLLTIAVAAAFTTAAVAIATTAIATTAVAITSASRTMVIAVFNWILSQLGFRARQPWYSQCSRRLGRGWDWCF